jgi:hypothetical protein
MVSGVHLFEERWRPNSSAKEMVVCVRIQLAPGLGNFANVQTNQRQSLDILECMAARELIKHAERVVVMHVRLTGQTSLLSCILPISGRILEEHDGKHHVNHNSLCCGRTEGGIIIELSQLTPMSVLLWFKNIQRTSLKKVGL